MTTIVEKLHSKHLVWLPSPVLFFIPLLLWSGPFGDHMSLSGDDSLLYYLRPWDWVHATPSQVLDANFLGYNPRTYFIPMFSVLGILSSTGLNTQGLAFGLLMAATYAGLARLIFEFTDPDDVKARYAALFGGIVGATAPLVLETQFHFLTGIYWQALLPWLTLFVAWHQRTGHWRWIVASALITVLLASALMQFAWTLTCGALFVTFLALLAGKRVFKPSLKRILLLGVIVIGCNSFWLLPTVAVVNQGTSQLATATSSTGKSESKQIVNAVAPYQSPASALSLHVSPAFIKNFGITYADANKWSASVGLLGAIPAIVLFVAIVRTFDDKVSNRRRWILFGLIGVVLAEAFFNTVVLLPFGTDLFVWMIDHVPLMTAVRNFYDKFAIPYVASIAVAAGYALWLLFRTATVKRVQVTTALLSILMLVHAAPHLAGAEFNMRHQNGHTDRTRSQDGLPADYSATLDAIKQLPPGPTMELPLSSPAWTPVASTHTKGLYLGVSPIYFLSGRDDYNGADSFISAADPSLRSRVANAAANEDVGEMAQIIRKTGIRYLVTTADQSGASNPSTYSTGVVNDRATEDRYTQTFINAFAPAVLQQHGRFEIREISSNVRTNVIELDASSRSSACSVSVDIRAQSATSARVVVPPTQSDCTLVLRKPFSDGWSATWSSNGSELASKSQSFTGNVNSFRIAAHTKPLTVNLTFDPQSRVWQGFALSGIWFAILAVAAYLSLRQQKVLRAVSSVEDVITIAEDKPSEAPLLDQKS